MTANSVKLMVKDIPDTSRERILNSDESNPKALLGVLREFTHLEERVKELEVLPNLLNRERRENEERILTIQRKQTRKNIERRKTRLAADRSAREALTHALAISTYALATGEALIRRDEEMLQEES